MKQELHVVLGASGIIGQAVVDELTLKKLKIRTVGRTKKTADADHWVKADLLHAEQAIRVLEGASYVYLCVGIAYNSNIWAKEWPVVMQNVITACERAKAKLIFVDNVYMYGPAPLKVPFDESHAQNPSSKKGEIRKIIADMLMDAHKEGRIKIVIGRSADFYGPNAINSSFYISFIKRMKMGQNALSLGKVDVKHTYSYTLDNGSALVALALDEDTYGQVWHLPVSRPVTATEVVNVLNEILGTGKSVKMLPRFLFYIMAVLTSPIKEIKEMSYQFDDPYIMNDDKFRKHFPDFRITALEDGLRAMVKSF